MRVLVTSLLLAISACRGDGARSTPAVATDTVASTIPSNAASRAHGIRGRVATQSPDTAIAKRLAHEAFERFHSLPAGIYGLRSTPNRYLLSLVVRTPGSELPRLRWLLYAGDSARPVLLDSTGDVDVGSIPVLFELFRRAVLANEPGRATGTLGLDITIVEGDSLVTLPRLKVGAPDPESDTGANSVFPYLTIHPSTTGLTLEFDTDLVWDVGIRDLSMICRSADSSLVVSLETDHWKVVRGARRSGSDLESCAST